MQVEKVLKAEVLSLARCIVPPISVLSPVLDYGRCFLRFPYERSVRLHNDTDLPAKYIILPEEELNIASPPILYESPQPKVSQGRAACDHFFFGFLYTSLNTDFLCL